MMIAPTSSSLMSLAFGMPGGTEWIILLILGLLIFGRRLPEVGRSLGRGIVEFKRGVKGIDDEIDEASSSPPPAAKLDEGAKPALTETSPAGDSVPRAKVGGEGANPYAPAEETGGNG